MPADVLDTLGLAGLVSVAGLVGAPVRHRADAEVGGAADLVARWAGETYPTITGLVVQVGRRRAFVPISDVAQLTTTVVRLRTGRLDLVDFDRRPGEVVLMGDVVDHQLVDINGLRVVRASDLYVAPFGSGFRLMGAEVSARSLLRRLGPAAARRRLRPARIIDWAAIQPFGRPGDPLRLRQAGRGLHRLRPSELADLLEELGRQQRQELLAALGPDVAADALEEMQAAPLDALLRGLESDHAAALVSAMEPDEATDALRHLRAGDAEEILGRIPGPRGSELRELIRYEPGSAGGLMTSAVVLAAPTDTVSAVRHRLGRGTDVRVVDAVVVVDGGGGVIDDIPLAQLFLADPLETLGDLAADTPALTVGADDELKTVIERFIDARATSVVVVDHLGHPVGRIFGDDIVDALVDPGPRRGLIA